MWKSLWCHQYEDKKLGRSKQGVKMENETREQQKIS